MMALGYMCVCGTCGCGVHGYVGYVLWGSVLMLLWCGLVSDWLWLHGVGSCLIGCSYCRLIGCGCGYCRFGAIWCVLSHLVRHIWCVLSHIWCVLSHLVRHLVRDTRHERC